MLSFPNAKINLGLNIIRKRVDGFHDLETVFYPVNIKDAVEIIEDDDATNDLIFSASGNPIPGDETDNLCIKTYRIIKKDHPEIPAVKIHLHKHIPTGAGLGGGSADAAALLLLINKKFGLNIPAEKLAAYSLQLGSDCPFFLINKPSLATGRGEMLQEIPVDLSAYSIMIVNPGIHVNTAEAFAGLNRDNFSPAGELKTVIAGAPETWKEGLKNDFEQTVFANHPSLKELKEKLYANGAVYSAMSGSGSSVYGIFKKNAIPDIKFPAHWFCQTV